MVDVVCYGLLLHTRACGPPIAIDEVFTAA
jgi:hypothetical protein